MKGRSAQRAEVHCSKVVGTHTDTTKDTVEAHTHTAFQFRWVTAAHRGNNSVADLPCDATHTFTEETQLTTLSSTVTEKVIEDKIESK